MEQLLSDFISSKIDKDLLELWFQGKTSSLNNLVSNSDEFTAQEFVNYFIENLHLSFDWFLKQSNNSLYNRPKPLGSTISNIQHEKPLNTENLESFPTLIDAHNALNKEKSPKKRINPTLISQPRNQHDKNFTKFKNSFDICDEKRMSNSDFFKEERELLKNFKLNTAKQSKNVTPNKFLEIKSFNLIVPKYEMVDSTGEIFRLKGLFVFLFMHNHLPSILEEIRFIFEILIKKTNIEQSLITSQNPSPTEKIFSSYHNCFYFAHLLFEDIFITNGFINFINMNAFNYILECPYLFDFRKDLNLKETLNSHYMKACSKLKVPLMQGSSDSQFVFFQPATDSKSNFPNEYSFSIFRKQRDEFYRILKYYHENLWQSNLTNDKKIQQIFSTRIRSMLELSKDVGNSYHLARLFISQLQKCCIDIFDSKKTAGNEKEQFLLNQNKFKRLQNRFVKKSSTDFCSSSKLLEENFNEKERFFCDFIYYADSYSFNQQLKIILKSQLIELTTLDIFSVENDIQDEFKNSLLLHLTNLNVLAKFLGFVCFYSFETTMNNNNNKANIGSEFLNQQVCLRQLSENQSPLLDIETYLANSMENHILILAVPWVVEFLIFIDPISQAMTYYNNVLSLLLLIYKYYLPNLTMVSSNHHSFTRIFIQFYLEKLFSMEKFNSSNRLHEMMKNITDQVELNNQLFVKFNTIKSSAKVDSVYLDFRDELLDTEVISYFFPQFSKLIIDIFKQFPTEIRKITPTSIHTKPSLSKDDRFVNSLNESKNILFQSKIEECFLNIHPDSVKKCIHFLTERISTTCIKHIKNVLYPEKRIQHFNEFILLNSVLTETQEFNKNIELIVKLAEAVRKECKSFIPEYCQTKIETIFPLVVNEDLDKSVTKFAIKLCMKKIEKRSINWIETNITNELIYSDLTAHIRNKTNSVEDNSLLQIDSKKQTETYQTFSKLVLNLRQLIFDLNQPNVDQMENISIMQLMSDLNNLRTDGGLSLSNTQFFDMTTLDLAICIISFKPQIMNDELLDKFIEYWVDQQVTYTRIICPKYFYILSKSKSPITTWLKYEFLLTRMLKFCRIKFADIEESTLSVLKQQWPLNMLTRFASLLKSITEFSKSNKLIDEDEDENSHDFLEWLAWFCAEQN